MSEREREGGEKRDKTANWTLNEDVNLIRKLSKLESHGTKIPYLFVKWFLINVWPTCCYFTTSSIQLSCFFGQKHFSFIGLCCGAL